MSANSPEPDRLQYYEALRASEARFRLLVDHATDAFFLHDANGVVLDVNAQACESLGYSRDELIGMHPAAFDVGVSPEFMNQLTARLEAGEVLTFESQHRRKDGSVFPVEMRLRGFWEDGRRLGISLARDITERKRTQEAVSLFRSLLDHTNDTIEVIDPETGRLLDVNEQACLAHGYTRDEYLTLRVHDIDTLVTEAQWHDNVARLRDSGSLLLESKHRRKDGSTFSVEISAAYVQLDRDYVLSIVRDITDRKRTQRALLESHNLLNAVVQGTSDSVFVKDDEGRYLMVNAAGAGFLGRSVDEVIGATDYELLPADAANTIAERDRQALSSAQAQTVEETVTVGGTTRIYLSTRSVYRDARGNVRGIIGISRDVTELKRLEEQFRQSQKMEAVGRLAGGVAHDFNNLLTVINSYSELAWDSLNEGDPTREMLDEVRKAGERAANLTRQLLAFSRKQVLQPRVVNVNTLLSELLNLLRRLIGEDVELTLLTSPGLGLATVDPAQFEQAITNLVVNARDAMPHGGRLLIETSNAELDDDYATQHPDVRPGSYVLVTVTDTGQGMDAATKSRIFEPFFTTKGESKGTGLGLSMVYGFVKQSGGHVDVYSEPGYGTKFTLYLPRADAAAEPTAGAQRLRVMPRGTETVLLVEDEEAVRHLARLVLDSHGYSTLEAHDGAEALRIAENHHGRIHIVVTDVVMPRMSGRELADVLAQTRPDAQILFMSGYTEEAVVRQGLAGSGAAFLQKPFSPAELARKVREVLDAGKRGR